MLYLTKVIGGSNTQNSLGEGSTFPPRVIAVQSFFQSQEYSIMMFSPHCLSLERSCWSCGIKISVCENGLNPTAVIGEALADFPVSIFIPRRIQPNTR